MVTDKKQHWLQVLFREKVLLPGNEGVIVPSGTTAERPPVPDNGTIRYSLTDNRLESFENGAWGPIGAGGTGVSDFLGLTDTPSAYTGTGGQVLRVNGGETAVEFVDGDTLWLPLSGGLMTGAINMQTNGITGLPITPISNTDAASKAYVDSVSAGLDPKGSCRAATTINILGYSPSGGTAGNGIFAGVDLTGPLTDGILMNPGDRVLVKDQTLPTENGIYVVLTGGPAGSMERAPDMDGTPANEVSGGNFTFVETGSQGGTGWVILFDGIIILNTHPINWTQFSGAGSASLAGLTDTIITAPALNDYLQYNGAAWINVGHIPRIQDPLGGVFVDTNIVSGRLEMEAADSATVDGGAVLITAGNSSAASNNGGAITVTTGAGQGGTSSNSGVLTLRGADATGIGVGGDVQLFSGNSGGDRRGGLISLQAGSTSGSSVDGGAITITSGNSTADGSGGDISLNGGTGVGGGNYGASINLKPGNGPTPGTVNILPHVASTASGLRFYEGTASGTNWVGFKAADTLAGDQMWTLPIADGLADQLLKTDGFGNLAWTSISVPAGTRIEDGDNDTFVDTDFTGADSDYMRVETGTQGPAGNGGLLAVKTGDGGSASGNGGIMTITTGSAVGGGAGGNFGIYTGAGTYGGASGQVLINLGAGGYGTASAGGAGGQIQLNSGNGGGSNFGAGGNGGNIQLGAGIGGAAVGAGNGGNGGSLILNAGNAGGSTGGTGGIGGGVTISAGDSYGTSNGPNSYFFGGNAGGGSGSVGGIIRIQAGSGNVPGPSQGGEIQLYAGSSAGDANGADVVAKASAGSSATASNHKGGDVRLLAGDAAGTNANGGKIIAEVGQPVGSGDRGHVEVLADGSGTDGGEIRFREGNLGANYVGLRAPTALAGDASWRLPVADGTINQVMITDGSEQLSFVDQVYDVGSSVIGAPIPLGDVWRFATTRAFVIHPSAVAVSAANAYASVASLATGSAVFELHLLGPSTLPGLVAGLGSPTCIGSVTFAAATQVGVIATWPPGGGPLPPPGLPFLIPPVHELVLHYPAPDATLGDISFTFDGALV